MIFRNFYKFVLKNLERMTLKKITGFILLTFITSLFFAGCEEEEPHYVRYVTAKEGVKVYKNKEGKGEPIVTIPYKTKIEVEGAPDKEWVEVEFKENGKEIEGYVKSEFLSAIEPVEAPAENTIEETSKETSPAEETQEKPMAEASENKEERSSGKETKKKETAIPTSTKEPVKKKTEKKTETKAPKKSGLAAQAQAVGSYLLTYNQGLKDAQISTSGIYKWESSVNAYKGTYEGSLASNISKITLSPAGNKLKGTLYYSKEEVSPMTGMIETQEKTASVTINPATGTISISTEDIKAAQIEFVEWGAGKGIIMKVTTPNTKFVLLKKTR